MQAVSLRDCLNSAVSQKAISSRQADELHAYFEVRFKKKRPGMTEREAAAAARDEIAAMMRQEAKEAKRHVYLTEARRKENKAFIEEYRNRRGQPDQLDAALSMMVNYGYKGGRSMEGRALAITAMAHRELADVMYHFRRSKVSGTYSNKADLPDLIRALNGEGQPSAEVKAFAGGIKKVFEDLRQRFNGAGGDIPKREDFDLPHSHNVSAIRQLGYAGRNWKSLGVGKKIDIKMARQRWKDFIRPLLDPDRMLHPKNGEVVGVDGLEDALDYAFDSIVSDGWAHRKPEARKFGLGKVANRNRDQRFLIFKDADAWLTYNDQLGTADPISTIFNYVNGMAKDIAAMEQFGPNPDAAIEWIKQAVQANIGKQQAGTLTAIKLPGMSAGKIAGYRIDSLWRELRGRDVVWDAPAEMIGDIRNLSTAAMLGSTGILSALTDPWVAAAGRRLAGLPIMRDVGGVLRRFASDTDKRAMARRAVIWSDYLHTMHNSARFVDQMFGHDWSRYLVDRALTFNALKPLTEARQRLEAAAFHETLGGFAERNTDWIDMPDALKAVMQGFGLTDKDWHKMRLGVDEAGFLDPGGVYAKTGDRQLAETYAEMITMFGERTVPNGDPRIKSMITGMTPKGTITGEAATLALQFMSFGLSFTARQLEAIYRYGMMARSKSGRVARGGWYFASMAMPLTVGAAMYTQILNVLNGKDPEDVTEPVFWAKAFVKGGGGGLFADFVDKAENRFGQPLAQQLAGPGAAFIGDTLGLTLSTIQDVIGVGEGKSGKEAVKYIGRYTPILASHPLTRAAYRRMFIDQLQWAVDPDADKAFKAQARKAGYWWRPGNFTPSRLPDPKAATGG